MPKLLTTRGGKIKNEHMQPIYFILFFILFLNISYSQDFRATQIHSIPLLMNPANTGNYTDDYIRINSLFANHSDETSVNQVFNISIDQKFLKNKSFAWGVNLLNSGYVNFPMSSKCIGLSFSKSLSLDRHNIHQLTGGVQLSYLSGIFDSEKGKYNRNIDVSVIKYFPDRMPLPFTGTAGYYNISAGAMYILNLENLLFQTGISAYNVTNPRGWNIMPDSWFRKRYRMSISTSLIYKLSSATSLSIDHFSWKEGIFLRRYIANIDQATEINESTYGLSINRNLNYISYSFGLFSRDWKSLSTLFSMKLRSNSLISLSYEKPLYHAYYNVSHFELGLQFALKRKNQALFSKNNFSNNASEKLNKDFSLITNNNFTITNQIFLKDTIQYDIDRDGILNNYDECPLDSGSLFNAGCPVQNNKTQSEYFAVSCIYYDFNSFEFNSNGYLIAAKLLEHLKANPDVHIYILGMASVEGSAHYNLILSRKRAINLASYLMSFGVQESRIVIDFAGSKHAKIHTRDPIATWTDRKVIIQLKNRINGESTVKTNQLLE